MLGLRTRLSLHTTNLSPRASRLSPDLFGLPGIREQRAREKRERLYRRIFRVASWALLLAAFFLAVYNTRLNMTETKRRAEVLQQMGYTRIAMLVPQGKRKCAMEWHENCLVCEFRMLGGTLKSTMC